MLIFDYYKFVQDISHVLNQYYIDMLQRYLNWSMNSSTNLLFVSIVELVDTLLNHVRSGWWQKKKLQRWLKTKQKQLERDQKDEQEQKRKNQDEHSFGSRLN
jgi:hypothetical protein